MIIPTLVQGGAEKQMSLLAANLPPDQFQVSVCVLTHSGPWETFLTERKIQVDLIGKRWKIDPFCYYRLQKHIRRQQPDIVHTWLFAANTYGRLAARWAKVKRLIAGERCVDLWKTSGHFWIDRQLAKSTSQIVTNSQGVVDFYTQHGLPPDKFRVIPNGIDLPQRVPSADVALPQQQEKQRLLWRSRLSIPPESQLLISVSRLWPQKRIKDIIWALDLASCTRDDLHLVIAGEGPQAARLQEFAKEVKIDHRVHFVGHLPDTRDLMLAGDFFVMASQYEGQSNSLMEAMGSRLPVIVSDIPGNRDLIPDAKFGWVFPMGDRAGLAKAICEATKSGADASARAAAAAERLQQEFSLKAMLDRYRQLYLA